MSARPTVSVPALPDDGLVAIIKRDCATCELVVPVLGDLARTHDLTIWVQDDPTFCADIGSRLDADLAVSWHHDIETVPTLIRRTGGEEADRIVGWNREEWIAFTGADSLGDGLPEWRPGCGSLSVDPSMTDELTVRFSGSMLRARRIEVAELEDEMEMAFDRGWSDGLPVVPPTEARVLRMLEGTTRPPDQIVATIPPDLVEVTVEQVAINAVMAGCKPEYLPVVLAAVEAACTDEFNMHGLLATTYFSGPVVIVNGPIVERIGMNSGHNVLGQGNRANSTIGRALQLVVRNLGGGRPGEVDMGMQGAPSKLGWSFAEREHDSPFEPLAAARGLPAGTDAVTLFAGQGPIPIVDQLSRTPESLTRSIASVLLAYAHPKLIIGFDCIVVLSPEHGRIYSEAGWGRARVMAELEPLLVRSGAELVRGAGGIAEGLPEAMAEADLPKFRAGGLQFVHAGGDAGLFSSLIGGWVSGDVGSAPVTVEVTP